MTQNKRTQKQAPHRTTHPVSTEHKNTNAQVNRVLLLSLLALSILMVFALLINLIRISRQNATTTANTEVEVETMGTDTGVSMRNNMYTIGNNPTDIQQEYFQNLTDALARNDPAKIAEAVVYNFVSDYFTWTNKDGNYEVGGLQYIYTPDIAGFEEWSRYNFYSDLDLYITQKGRDHLIEVKSVSTTTETKKAPDFTVITWDDPETKREIPYESYEVNVSWEYKNASDASNFPTEARFFVINNDGRLEIAEFYDMESIREWEAKNASSTDTDN